MYRVQSDKRNELQTTSSDKGGVSLKVVFSSHLYFDGLVVLPGGSPYPRMDGRKIANLLQDGYRMPKPQHVDENCKFYFSNRSLLLYWETLFKSLTDHLNNSRYQIMMKCWKNDQDARPTFTELRNQLKDMENLHKVRILINMKVSFHVKPTGLGSSANWGFNLNSIGSR